jgi:hypothetical protein
MNLRALGGEVAVGDVDGDALLALGRQTVDQQREVQLAPCAATRRSRAPSRGELVVEAPNSISYSSRPIRVDLPSSTLPQVMNRSRSLA